QHARLHSYLRLWLVRSRFQLAEIVTVMVMEMVTMQAAAPLMEPAAMIRAKRARAEKLLPVAPILGAWMQVDKAEWAVQSPPIVVIPIMEALICRMAFAQW